MPADAPTESNLQDKSKEAAELAATVRYRIINLDQMLRLPRRGRSRWAQGRPAAGRKPTAGDHAHGQRRDLQQMPAWVLGIGRKGKALVPRNRPHVRP